MNEWKTMRLKDLGSTGSGTTPKSDKEEYYDNGVHPWINTGCVQDCMITTPAKYVTDLALKECTGLKYYPSNTIIIAMYGGGTIGNVGITTFPTTINQACFSLVPDENLVRAKYLFYAIQNNKSWMICHGFGGTQVNLSQGQIGNFAFKIPSISTQVKIVEHINKELIKIDSRISILSKQLDAYSRLKTSIINRAVTRGLDENVELMDSGIEWIGEIPLHWSINSIKRYGIIKGGNGFSEELQGDYLQDTKFIKVNSLESNIDVNRVYDTVSIGVVRGNHFNLFSEGDIVFAKVGAALLLNRFCILPFDSCIDNNMMCFSSKTVNNRWFRYACIAFVDFKRIVNSGPIPSVNQNQFGSILLPIPPLPEQQAIATYLDDKCSKIDAAIANINKQIDALKRLKRALINEIITGKRAV